MRRSSINTAADGSTCFACQYASVGTRLSSSLPPLRAKSIIIMKLNPISICVIHPMIDPPATVP